MNSNTNKDVPALDKNVLVRIIPFSKQRYAR